ncbi:hypothetical protein PVAND_012206 [Polypedilum vanderplanki]|uniref:BTB domain-containing protein n=1 Tax=Polypedilum vanderplanki TaxID=319348 RepID=A0A9J6CLQ9_POLVA|nr:hypothetical protein PVAND_012206 [Polypedilum vanderplanki]
MDIINSWKRTISLNFENVILPLAALPKPSKFSKVFIMTIGLENIKMSIDGYFYQKDRCFNCMNIKLSYIDNPRYHVDKIIIKNKGFVKIENGTETIWEYNYTFYFPTNPYFLHLDIFGKIISEKRFPLTNQFAGFYLKDLLSDIKIISRDEISFPAHRLILSNYSTVFNKMFISDMIEAKSIQIKIEDADGDAIKEFLRFIYLGEVEDKKQLPQLFYLAEKYDLSALKSFCTDLSLKHINYDNVLALIVLADGCNENLMFYNCVKYIEAHFEEIKNSEEWKLLNNSIMTKIMNNIAAIEIIFDKESIVKAK